MMQSMDSRWRYPLAFFVGSAGGFYIGAMLASMYLILVYGQSPASLDLMRPWLLEHSQARVGSNPATLQAAWLITLVPAVIFAVIGLTSVHRGSLTEYDEARFQSRAEMRRNRMIAPLKANGFLFAKLTRPSKRGPFVSATPDRFPHAMMIAPTGRGKGVGFVLPNLLHFSGSAVILDVKGENFEKTSIHRSQALGNRVWYFSPFDHVSDDPEGAGEAASKIRTHRFNPLTRIARLKSVDQQYTAINAMADLFLIVESANAESFFQAGRSLFVAACLRAIEVGRPTIGEALRIMSGGGAKKDSYRAIADTTGIPVVAEVFLTMADQTDRILDSYVSVIRGAGLELWLDPAVDRATSGSDFDFSTFRREPQSLYIVVNIEHVKTLAPLIRLIFADAISSLQRALPAADEPHAVMFLMDEFDQLGRQPLVLSGLKTIRAYGGRFFIITQSVPGLEDIYGEVNRRALQAGAGVQIFMTPQDDRTAEVISKALGKKTIIGKTRSQDAVRGLGDSTSISRRSEERPLISPSELARFPLDKVIVLAEGQYPIMAEHIRYYADEHFRPIEDARAGFPLPYPPLAVPASHGPLQMTPRAAPKPVELSETEKAEIVETALAPRFSGLADAAERPARSSRGRRRPVERTGPTSERGATDDGENMNGNPNAEEPVRTGAATRMSVAMQDVLGGDDGSGT